MALTNIPNKAFTFLKEVRLEIRKVNWPTRQETIKYVIIIVCVSALIAAFLGALDFIFITLLNKFIL